MISIAPMLGLTTRHCRYFFRLLTKHALLYTEMISTGDILKHSKELQYNQIKHPLALQLGGSDPKALAECAKIGEDFGYDEINLNAGCPSARVQAGADVPRAEIVEEFMAYAEKQIALGENISYVTKPLGGLFHGVSGAKNWRRRMNNYFLGK